MAGNGTQQQLAKGAPAIGAAAGAPPQAQADHAAQLKFDSSNRDIFLEAMEDQEQASPFAAFPGLRDDSMRSNSPLLGNSPTAGSAAVSGSATGGATLPVRAAPPTLADLRDGAAAVDIIDDEDDVKGQGDLDKSVGGAGAGAGAGAPDAHLPSVNTGKRKKLIPLRQVLRDSYEYHGLNELALFCITALSVTLVLYWHWGSYTAIFKAGVQRSFQSYGNPDWQGQSMVNVDTMNDAVEYSTGWMEFWLQRAEYLNWTNQLVRAGEYGDMKYVRLLVNIDSNCQEALSPYLECYQNSQLTQQLKAGAFGGTTYKNILDYSGWKPVSLPFVRDMSFLGKGINWWSYTIIAPRYNGQPATRDQYLGRLYNITRNTNLNSGDCDWLATSCLEGNSTQNPCASQNVPNNNWFEGICNGSFPDTVNGKPLDVAGPNGTWQPQVVYGNTLQRGNRSFVHNPWSAESGQHNILDLKPFLSKYAYSIVLDVVAANAMGDREANKYGLEPDRDRAVFSMAFQRSAVASEKPDRVMWQITSTVPVRTSFYTYTVDWQRVGFEAMLYLCMIFVLFSQAWQFRVCLIQFRSWKPFFAHYWNDYEVLSTIVTLAWIIFYWALYATLLNVSDKWKFDEWDVNTSFAHEQLTSVVNWSYAYSAWLYMGIVVDFLICLRIARYMRIHVGLKAFYQVFIIAAREFLDFAVFLLFILVLLGSAVFAFFQLTGGNYQFLRFADGLSVMTRLTFGFLTYEDFQSQALGVGAAVSAVTFLFWVAVLLLVVYTQNIILAIVAEAYEEAKAKLGTAETSFLMLILMRLLFLILYIMYRVRMFCVDVHRLFTGKKRLTPSTNARQVSGAPAGVNSYGPGSSHHDGDIDGHVPSQAHSVGTPSTWRSGIDGHSQPGSPWSTAAPSHLMPAASVAGVLPKEVEEQLYNLRHGPPPSAYSHKHHRSLIWSRSKAAASKQDSAGTDVEMAAKQALDDAVSDTQQFKHVATFREIAEKQSGLGHRLSNFWLGLVSERHDVRMYKDLLIAPKKNDEGWIAAWKRRYWAPWCVARTSPVKSLMYLYQDFTSYKLKEQCTWKEAHVHGSNVFKPGDGKGSCSAESFVFKGLPPLTEDSFVDEQTLSQLFLVSSKMAGDVNILFGPFKYLSANSVSYLVRGISEVYGIDMEEGFEQDLLGGTGVWRGYTVMKPAGSGGSGSAEFKDATLGQTNQRRTGGFIANLNKKRREGDTSANDNRQLALLGHAQRRLEELAHRTERSLNTYRANQVQQANYTELHLKEQQQKTQELLKSIQTLQAAVNSLAHTAPTPHGPAPAPGSVTAERAPSSRWRTVNLSESSAAGTLGAAATAVAAANRWGRKTAASSGGGAAGSSSEQAQGAAVTKQGGNIFASIRHRTSPASGGATGEPLSSRTAVLLRLSDSHTDAGLDISRDNPAVDTASVGTADSRAASAALSGGASATSAAGVPDGQMLLQLQAQMEQMLYMMQQLQSDNRQ